MIDHAFSEIRFIVNRIHEIDQGTDEAQPGEMDQLIADLMAAERCVIDQPSRTMDHITGKMLLARGHLEPTEGRPSEATLEHARLLIESAIQDVQQISGIVNAA